MQSVWLQILQIIFLLFLKVLSLVKSDFDLILDSLRWIHHPVWEAVLWPQLEERSSTYSVCRGRQETISQYCL